MPLVENFLILVVPARAGVIPISLDPAFKCLGGSRASGGNPIPASMALLLNKWFPRERG